MFWWSGMLTVLGGTWGQVMPIIQGTARSTQRIPRGPSNWTATTGCCTVFVGGFSSCHSSGGIKDKSAAHVNEGQINTFYIKHHRAISFPLNCIIIGKNSILWLKSHNCESRYILAVYSSLLILRNHHYNRGQIWLSFWITIIIKTIHNLLEKD